MWLLASGSVNGIFNVGTGKARSFRDLIVSAYDALGASPKIEYVDMPLQIATATSILRKLSSNVSPAPGGFTSLEDAVSVYVKNFLDRPDRYR